MKKIKDQELVNVIGGGVTSTMINAISKAINTIYNLGQAIGSAFRRAKTGKICSAN